MRDDAIHLKWDLHFTLQRNRMRRRWVELDRRIMNNVTGCADLIGTQERLGKLVAEVQGFVDNQHPWLSGLGALPNRQHRGDWDFLYRRQVIGERVDGDSFTGQLQYCHVGTRTGCIGVRIKRCSTETKWFIRVTLYLCNATDINSPHSSRLGDKGMRYGLRWHIPTSRAGLP